MQFHIHKWEDLLALENAIRRHLGCQSTSCAFLESAKYTRLRLDIIRQINGVPCCSIAQVCCLGVVTESQNDMLIDDVSDCKQEHYVYPSSNLLVHVKDYQTVELRIISGETVGAEAAEQPEVAPRNTKRQKTAACAPRAEA